MPYNEFTLPMSQVHRVSVCTLLSPNVSVPPHIKLYDGDNSVTGFLRAIRQATREQVYDIIHAHSPHVGVLLLVAKLIFGHISGATVYTIHNSYQNFRPRNRLLLIPVFMFFNRIIPCSQASFESFPTIYKRLGGSRIQVVQNGLDLARLNRVIEKTQFRKDSNFTVVSIGRLVKIKNPIATLEAFLQLDCSNSKLVYIGDGPLKTNLSDKIADSTHGDKVELTGVIPRETVYQRLGVADLFVSTSYGEGLPIAVLEAMACGCPVILSDIPPHQEIAEGVDFIPLLPPSDATEFAREIKRFIQMTPKQRIEIGRRCKRLVEEKFSLARMHKNYFKLYTEVIENVSAKSGLAVE